MNTRRDPLSVYVVIAAGVWLGMTSAIYSVLKGSPHLIQVLLILLGGAFVFIILIPLAFRRTSFPPRNR